MVEQQSHEVEPSGPTSGPPAGPKAFVSRGRRIPAIWFIPVLAAVLGLYLVVYTAMNEGPEISVTFQTAEGIDADKTKIKALSVEVGIVKEVRINDDRRSVTVIAKLDRAAESLLGDETRFWVVRPRLGAGGVSGLGTIMSGAYIELQPGPNDPSEMRDFVGLEDIPTTPLSAPGLWMTLVGAEVGSLGPGQPVLFRGYPVGRIEDRVFDLEAQRVRYRVFIDEPYDLLVSDATVFWDTSGVSLSASADGVKLKVGSLQTLIAGGVAFDLPSDASPGTPVDDGVEFVLYEDQEKSELKTYEHSIQYVVEFHQSIRGLVPGAPVEYRGLPVGSAVTLLMEGDPTGQASGDSMPVLIEIEPARFGASDDEAGVESLRNTIERGVARGLRVSLESGNLITGSKLVVLDFFPDEPAATLGEFGKYPTIPAALSGIDSIGRRVNDVLAKVNNLPLERTVNELNEILHEVRTLVASDEVEQLPVAMAASLNELQTTLESFSPGSPFYDQLERAVGELNRTLQSVEEASRTIGEQPSTVIFSKPIEPDPEPNP
jgi:paraquat-inducible protein B